MITKTIIGSNVDAQTNPNGRAIGDDIAMQMASITYCSLNGNQSVRNTTKKYLPDWEVVWLPTEAVNGNWACIFYNGVQFVVAIRGSILNFSWATFQNWFEQDFNVFYQTQWNYPYDTATNPMISQGADNGLNDVMQLQNSNGQTILDYLLTNAIPQGKFLCVTGHSLGGNLATVYALYLKYQLVAGNHRIPELFSVLTFAAPTAWNQAFVDQFTAAFTNSWRYYSVLDIVPFSAYNINGLEALFPPPAPAANQTDVGFVTLSDVFNDIASRLEKYEQHYHSVYAPVNQHRGAIALNTQETIYPMTGEFNIERWFEQAGAQHDHNHYLDWLGATEVNCAS